MVWFRPAASHYPSQCWQLYVGILRHNVLSNCHNINDYSRISDPFVRRNHRWEMVATKLSDVALLCFFFVSLNYLLDKLSSCPWLKTPWCQCHFTVLTTCHFENVVRPQCVNSAKYFKMLIPSSACYIGYHECQFYHSKMGNYSWSLCLVPCLVKTKVLKVPGHQQV